MLICNRKNNLFLLVHVDDIKVLGRREGLAPMWASLRKKIELGDFTPLVDQVQLECTQRSETVDEETIRTNTDIFHRNTTSNVEETPTKKTCHQNSRGFVVEL